MVQQKKQEGGEMRNFKEMLRDLYFANKDKNPVLVIEEGWEDEEEEEDPNYWEDVRPSPPDNKPGWSKI